MTFICNRLDVTALIVANAWWLWLIANLNSRILFELRMKTNSIFSCQNNAGDSTLQPDSNNSGCCCGKPHVQRTTGILTIMPTIGDATKRIKMLFRNPQTTWLMYKVRKIVCYFTLYEDNVKYAAVLGCVWRAPYSMSSVVYIIYSQSE